MHPEACGFQCHQLRSSTIHKNVKMLRNIIELIYYNNMYHGNSIIFFEVHWSAMVNIHLNDTSTKFKSPQETCLIRGSVNLKPVSLNILKACSHQGQVLMIMIKNFKNRSKKKGRIHTTHTNGTFLNETRNYVVLLPLYFIIGFTFMSSSESSCIFHFGFFLCSTKKN